MSDEKENGQTASETATEQHGIKFRSTSGGSVVVRSATEEEETKEVENHAQLAKKRTRS